MSFQVGGINVRFNDFSPTVVQRNIIVNTMHALLSQKNAFIESPEGIERAFLVLSAAISYQQANRTEISEPPMKIDPVMQNTFEISKTNANKSFQIIVVCNSENTISQLIHLVKRMNNVPSTLILQNIHDYCLNSDVKIKDNPLFWCSSVRSVNECKFCSNDLKINDISGFDIEEIKSSCIEHTQCPYLLTKDNIKEADVIFCTLETFFFVEKIEKLGLNNEQNILIFEDLPSIENILLDMCSFSLFSGEIDSLLPNDSSLKSFLSKLKNVIIDHSPEIIASGLSCDAFTVQQIFEEIGFSDSEFVAIKENLEVLFSQNLSDEFIQYNSYSKLYIIVYLIGLARENPNDFVFDIFANDEQMIFRSLSIGPVFKDFTKTAHSIIFTANVLTPFDSIATSLNTNFEIVYSGMHPFANDNFAGFTLSYSSDDVVLSSNSENKEQTYNALGKLIESQCQNIPDGIVLFIENPFDMILSWRKNNFTKRIKKHKPLFYQKQSDKYIDEYKSSISVGNGGLLITNDINAICDLSGRQLRCLFFFGIPKRMDRLSELKRIHDNQQQNDQQKMPETSQRIIENQIKSELDFSEQNGLRDAYLCAESTISQPGDFGIVVFIDSRFQNYIDAAPRWIKQATNKITTQSVLTKNIKQFFTTHVAPEEEFTLSVDRRAMFICAMCESPILTSSRITTIDTFDPMKQGFLEIIGSQQKTLVLPITNKYNRTIHCSEENIQWKVDDGIGYSPLVCECGRVVGAEISVATVENEESLEDIWLAADCIVAREPMKRSLQLSQSQSKKSQSSQMSQSPVRSQKPKSSPKDKKKLSLPKGQTTIDFS